MAQLAGVPATVIRAARKHLSLLETQSLSVTPQFDLFTAPTHAPVAEAAPTDDLLAAALDDIDPDALSPREALDALYQLKKLRL